MTPPVTIPPSVPESLGVLAWWTTPDQDTAPEALKEALTSAGLDKYLADQPAYPPAAVAAIFLKAVTATCDPFQVKPRSGVYFVPRESTGNLLPVRKALLAVGGTMFAFKVPGDEGGRTAVRAAVTDGLIREAGEALKNVGTYGDGTNPQALKAMSARLTALTTRADAHAAYLGDEKATVLAAIETAREALRAKVAELSKILV